MDVSWLVAWVCVVQVELLRANALDDMSEIFQSPTPHELATAPLTFDNDEPSAQQQQQQQQEEHHAVAQPPARPLVTAKFKRAAGRFAMLLARASQASGLNVARKPAPVATATRRAE